MFYCQRFAPDIVLREKNRGRLGIGDSAHVASQRGGIPYPIQLRIKDTRVVNIAAGGW